MALAALCLPGPPAAAVPVLVLQVHDASAFIPGLAQQRGRNAEWAERAVREAVCAAACRCTPGSGCGW